MWGELSATSRKTLQRLQNRAARIVLRRDSSKDTFNVLGWTKLETKWKRHKCVLVYKCLNNLVRQYLSDYFTRNYAEELICTCPKSNLALQKELLVIRAQHFLIYYLVACNRQIRFPLLKF